MLPEDGVAGTLVGRAWIPDADNAGPSVVLLRSEGVFDVSAVAPTMAGLLNGDSPLEVLARAPLNRRIGSLEEVLENSLRETDRDSARPWLLAPGDLQAIKACGVTFVASLVERVVEEQSGGDLSRAADVRRTLEQRLGVNLREIQPGSEESARLKGLLQEKGLWSQYLEVGLGPDAEVFTKAQPMSAVGSGAQIGIHPDSSWNNPEPEVVIAVNAGGRPVGACLGNDVNLRDFEGRSALLLGRAKDNNGSCAIGPFVRLFDDTFDLDDVRRAELDLEVAGEDGFVLRGNSSMAEISRDVEDLIGQTIGASHQYPDGLLLFLGTLFAPTQDRDEPGNGFTHRVGDRVSIRAGGLGRLVNYVDRSDCIPPWEFGTLALMSNLARRGLLSR